MVAWTPELYNQYGPNNPMLQSFLDSDKSGNPSHDINDPSFGGGPSAPGGASALSNLLKNQASTATNIPSTMNSPPAPAIQQQALPNAQGWDFPRLQPQSGGEYHLPARTDTNQLTSYQSEFDTPVAQALQRQMTEQSGAWNNQALPGWAQAFARGITPYGVQLAAQGQDSKRQQAAASMLNDYTNARANDQQGLERNTAAYGNVGDAYAKQQMLPYQMRAAYNLGNQRDDAGTAALARAAQSNSKALQIKNMTPYLQDTQTSIQDRNEGAAYNQTAHGDQTYDLTQPKMSNLQAQTAQHNAAAGNQTAQGKLAGAREIQIKNKGISPSDVKSQQTTEQLVRSFNVAQQNVAKFKALVEDEDPQVAALAKQKYAAAVAVARVAQDQLKKRGYDPNNPVPKTGMPEVPIEDGSDGKLIPVNGAASSTASRPSNPVVGQTYHSPKGDVKYLGNDQWQPL